MHHDPTGLGLSTREATAARALGDVQQSFLCYRRDLGERVKALLQADPEYGFAHTLRAILTLFAFRRSDTAAIGEALAAARALDRGANERERGHLQAAQAWAAGDPLRAVRLWSGVFARWPTDVFAYRFHHFLAFWIGRPEDMLALAERASPYWREEWPFYGALLSARAFAHEESGHLPTAENLGRRAVELDPGDPWGAHAVAHVLEMQQRHAEGVGWIDSLQDHWADRNNIAHHLWWHHALYHYELGDDARVLELYDRRFRDLDAPLTRAMPDLYIDIQNAVSMLVRLELQGIDVGARWRELGEHSVARIGDCTNLFSVPHFVLALLATGRETEAGAMIEAVRAFAEGGGAGEGEGGTDSVGADQRRAAREALLPVCEAIMERERGDPDRACDRFRAALGGAFRLGGSHAQQDLFGLLAADCALRADRQDVVSLLAGRLGGRYGWTLGSRRGYRATLRAG